MSGLLMVVGCRYGLNLSRADIRRQSDLRLCCFTTRTKYLLHAFLVLYRTMTSNSTPSLAIAPSSTHLENVKLHLMPFGIAYTGPAPVSTYFMVKDAPKDEEKEIGEAMVVDGVVSTTVAASDLTPNESLTEVTSLAAMDSQSTAASTLVEPESSSAGLLPQETILSSNTEEVLAGGSTTEKTRYVAAFRGRTIHGLEMEVPEGYAGFILGVEGEANKEVETKKGSDEVSSKRKLEESSSGKSKVSKKVQHSRKGRTTRNSTPVVEVEDEPMEDVHQSQEPNNDEDAAERILVPTAGFSSFTIWSADNVIDAGKDEYIRSLDEWVRMSALVSYHLKAFSMRN